MPYVKWRGLFGRCFIVLAIRGLLFAAAIFSYACSYSALSQPVPIWANFTPENSDLPNNPLRALAIGADGALWAGTAGGLARLDKDGQWRTYSTARTNGGLPCCDVLALAIGADGALWAGTA